MKALITGGLGYIGSATALRLKELGHEILIVDDGRDSVAHKGLFGGLLGEGPGRVFMGSIDHPALRSILIAYRPDVVFHFAASTSVGEGERDPAGYAENNVGAFARFLALFPEGVPLNIVHASSAAVYAPMSVSIPEVAPKEPQYLSFYGKTKLMGEALLEALAARQKLRFVGLRYFNVAGKMYGILERRRPEGHLIPRLEMAHEKHEGFFTVNGTDFMTHDGTAIRDYVHLEDVVRANVVAAERLIEDATGSMDIANSFFNIGSGVGTTVHEVACAFMKASGKPLKLVDGPRRTGDPSKLVADVSRARKVLGWNPELTLTEAITSVVC